MAGHSNGQNGANPMAQIRAFEQLAPLRSVAGGGGTGTAAATGAQLGGGCGASMEVMVADSVSDCRS